MKKLFEEIKKNYLVAVRNPFNYLVFILGPVLFVLLIGLSFGGSSLNSDVNIIVVGEEEFGVVSYLEEIDDVNIVQRTSVNDCRQEILSRNIHGCISFLEEPSQDIDIYLDFSRISRVYLIQNLIERQIDELRYDLSISALQQLQKDIDIEDEDAIQEFFPSLNEGLNSLGSDISTMRGKLLQNTQGFVENLGVVRNDFQNYRKELSDFQREVQLYEEILIDRKTNLERLQDVLVNNRVEAENTQSQICQGSGNDYSNAFITGQTSSIPQSADTCDMLLTGIGFLSYFDNEVTEILDELSQVEEGLSEIDDVLSVSIRDIDIYFDIIDEERGLAASELSSTLGNLEETLTVINSYEGDTESVQQSLVTFTDQLESIRENLDFDRFVDPVNYNIRNALKSVNTLDNLLPLIISVVILFTSLLLGVVIHEKETKSKGFSRNILQGSKMRFYLANYFFVLITVLVELLILLAAFYLFFEINVDVNILYLVLVAAVYISLWTFTGFFVAGISKSSEIGFLTAVTLSITIFMFSGGMVSIETFPQYMQTLAQMSPMIHFEEVIRELFFLNPSRINSYISLLYLVGLTATMFLVGYITTKGEANE